MTRSIVLVLPLHCFRGLASDVVVVVMTENQPLVGSSGTTDIPVSREKNVVLSVTSYLVAAPCSLPLLLTTASQRSADRRPIR
jgi:hypothetical protein